MGMMAKDGGGGGGPRERLGDGCGDKLQGREKEACHFVVAILNVIGRQPDVG